MLVVAHRLQTVMNADLIAVLDAGRVVEAGAKDGGLTYWGSSQFLEGSLKFSLGGGWRAALWKIEDVHGSCDIFC